MSLNLFESAHALYRQVCILASDTIYVDIETRFMHVVSSIEDRLNELCRPEPSRILRSEVAANLTMNAQGQTVIRVETARKPQIGKFNGSPADWPAF